MNVVFVFEFVEGDVVVVGICSSDVVRVVVDYEGVNGVGIVLFD